jgi:hypothetical protein
MIGKIILVGWIAAETFLHIKYWGKDRPVKIVGLGTIFADLFDLATFIAVVIWW